VSTILLLVGCIECGAGKTADAPIAERLGEFPTIKEAKAYAENRFNDSSSVREWFRRDGLYSWDLYSDAVVLIVEIGTET